MWFEFSLVAIGAFLAALVIGSAGFAFAIVVTGIWIHVLPPAQLVLLASACATLLHAVSVWQFRRDIEFDLLWPMLAGAVFGVPLGVYALQRIDVTTFRHLFGAFMIAYGAYMLARPRLPVVNLRGGGARAADAAVGWVSGILGGIAMVHGTLATIWCGLRGWDKRRSRSLYQPYIGFTAVLVMLASGTGAQADVARLAPYLLVCLPAMGAGLWLGFRLFDWVSEARFRRLLLWLILVSGVSLQF